MAITKPCGLQGKIFHWGNRTWKVHSFSWNDAMYICDCVGGGSIRYFTPDEILLILLKEGCDDGEKASSQNQNPARW